MVEPRAQHGSSILFDAHLFFQMGNSENGTMWIGNIGFMVWTKDALAAGTDSLVTVEILRNGNLLFTGRVDYPHLDDLERGSVRFYSYTVPNRYLDRTPQLPDGMGRIPPPTRHRHRVLRWTLRPSQLPAAHPQ
jgi:hypothetical protein